MVKKYDIIYLLGSNCACALYLNKNNLRNTSGPLDWVVGLDFKQKIDLILNDFKEYCNLEDLEIITSKNECNPHISCKNKKNGCYFFHDFPMNVPLETSYHQVAEKYERRIKRFYDNIYTKEKVLLVWFSLDIETPLEDIKQASEKLNKKFGKEINLLCIEHNENLSEKEIKIQKLSKNVTKIELYAKNHENIEGFSKGNVKKCNKIFKQYALKQPFAKVVKRQVIKILCNLIPIKSLRKKCRNQWLYEKNK